MIFLQLFWAFFKIGLFTFGGGYAMLPLIQEEVTRSGWISGTDLINFVAISESTPGPIAVNLSTYVGMETAGIGGALCATTGVVLPSFMIILFVAGCYEKFKESSVVKGIMTGLKPAVVGMILAAIVSAGKAVFWENGLPTDGGAILKSVISAILFVVMFILIRKKTHPIKVICLSAGFGIVFGYLLGL